MACLDYINQTNINNINIPDWQEFLTESYHSLARIIRPHCFYSHLRSKGVFDLSDQEYVEKTYVTTVMKAGSLIDLIMTKGENGFKAFMEVVEYNYPELFLTITGTEPRPPPKEFANWRSKYISITDTVGLMMNYLAPLQESLQEKREAFKDLQEKLLTLKEENEECSKQLIIQIDSLKQQVDSLINDKETLKRELEMCQQSKEKYEQMMEEMREQRDKELERSNQLRERCDIMGSKVTSLNVDIEAERLNSMRRQPASPLVSTPVTEGMVDLMKRWESLNDDFLKEKNKQADQFRDERDRLQMSINKLERELMEERENNKMLKAECQKYMKDYKVVIERMENLEKEMEEQVEKQMNENPTGKIIRNKYSKKETLPKILRLDRERQTSSTPNDSRNGRIFPIRHGASPLVVFAPKMVEKELHSQLATKIKTYPFEIIKSEEEMNRCAYNSDILYSAIAPHNKGYSCVKYSTLLELKETCLVSVPYECVFRMKRKNIHPIIIIVKFINQSGLVEFNKEEERFEQEQMKFHTVTVDEAYKSNINEIVEQILPEIKKQIRDNK